jgi:hypothetical protein
MMDIPTSQELNEIEARCDAATEGPWNTRKTKAGLHVNTRAKEVHGTPVLAYLQPGTGRMQENAAFMAAARTDMSRLIRAVRALALDNAILERAIEVDGSCIDGSSPICPIHDTAYCDGRGHCVELLREFLRVHPERMGKAAGIPVDK